MVLCIKHEWSVKEIIAGQTGIMLLGFKKKKLIKSSNLGKLVHHWLWNLYISLLINICKEISSVAIWLLLSAKQLAFPFVDWS